MLCELLYSERARSTMARDATPKRDITVPPVPPVSHSTSIIFEDVNRLKDEASFPRWDTALYMLVPGIVHAYLQSGNFPAEWSITTQITWKDYNNDIALTNVIRLGKVDIEHVLVAARLFNSNFNDGLSTWRETYLQLHEGEDMIKSMRTAAYNIIDRGTSTQSTGSDKPGDSTQPCDLT